MSESVFTVYFFFKLFTSKFTCILNPTTFLEINGKKIYRFYIIMRLSMAHRADDWEFSDLSPCPTQE